MMFVVLVWVWLALVAAVLVLALCRIIIARGTWTVIHVRTSELCLIPQQVAQERRLERIDLLGQTLTAAAILLGVVLGIAYLCIALGELLPARTPAVE